MNDFTKEELVFIKETLSTDIKYYGADHIGHSANEKTQSMIDNYCEHERVDCTHEWNCELSEFSLVGENVPLMPTVTKVRCKHCGKLNDNQ